jgi:hypothetical protein
LLVLRRKALIPLLAALMLLCCAGDAYALAEEELPNGRLGYTWVPDPPRQPVTRAERVGANIAKVGGGVIVGFWVLRKMFGEE